MGSARGREDLENPLGVRGLELQTWLKGAEAFKKIHGQSGGTQGIDNEFAAASFENIGAWILGRNMFGPARDEWKDGSWNGWWGDNPPFCAPVFVLTHYGCAPLEMEGGTTFYFVIDGPESAFQRAKEAARGKDVRIGGGERVVRHYLAARQIDELHLAVSPVGSRVKNRLGKLSPE